MSHMATKLWLGPQDFFCFHLHERNGTSGGRYDIISYQCDYAMLDPWDPTSITLIVSHSRWWAIIYHKIIKSGHTHLYPSFECSFPFLTFICLLSFTWKGKSSAVAKGISIFFFLFLTLDFPFSESEAIQFWNPSSICTSIFFA